MDAPAAGFKLIPPPDGTPIPGGPIPGSPDDVPCNDVIAETGGVMLWARPWRGIVGGRARWLVAAICEAIEGPMALAQPRASVLKGEQKELFMPPKGDNRAPGVLKTFVVFLRFFHLARRFWNHT